MLQEPKAKSNSEPMRRCLETYLHVDHPKSAVIGLCFSKLMQTDDRNSMSSLVWFALHNGHMKLWYVPLICFGPFLTYYVVQKDSPHSSLRNGPHLWHSDYVFAANTDPVWFYRGKEHIISVKRTANACLHTHRHTLDFDLKACHRGPASWCPI